MPKRKHNAASMSRSASSATLRPGAQTTPDQEAQKTKHSVVATGSPEKWSKSKKKRMRKVKARQADEFSGNKSKSEQGVSGTRAAPGKARVVDDTPTDTNRSKLQDSFKARLAGSRFRLLNEELYTNPSDSSYDRFSKQPELYEQYHQGFRKQVEQWPMNPVDTIIQSVKSASNFETTTTIADFGCGDAALAKQLLRIKFKGRCPFVVHSFDLVSDNNLVTACDMANTPLPTGSVDIAVFCLALMGTNLADFIREAHRVLKDAGRLKIAEVRSRFESKSGKDQIDDFVQVLDKLGFECVSQDKSSKLFVFLELKKNGRKPNRKLQYTAKPCIYKRR